MRSWLLPGAGLDTVSATADWLVTDFSHPASMINTAKLRESAATGQTGLAALLPPPVSGDIEEHLAAALRLGARMMILRKAEGCADIQRADMLLRLQEARLGLADGTICITALLDANGVLQARNLRSWSRRLRAVGLDFGERAFSPDSETAVFARAQVALAAQAAGISAIGADSAPHSGDFLARCKLARENGFGGMFVGDPEQAEIANAVFQ